MGPKFTLILFFFLSVNYHSSGQPTEMVLIEGGTFNMGCSEELEPRCSSQDGPVHQVTLPNFCLGKHEVTQNQWVSLIGNTPEFGFPNCGGECPVEQVSWYDVIVYCNRLSEKEGLTPCYYIDETYTTLYGKSDGTWSLPNSGEVYWLKTANGYRLPTEAEWEYAARGGNKSQGYRYSGSDDINEVTWHLGNSNSIPHNVGTKAPNEIGIHDMSGNVWEFCWDRFVSNYYNDSPDCQPFGPDDGDGISLRGGSWGNPSHFTIIGPRGRNDPDFRHYRFGFRLARSAIDPNFCLPKNRLTDSLALINLYNATDGQNWINTWNISQPMDNWFGLVLNVDGRVTSLDLRNNELSGEIPGELGDLNQISVLNLSGNNLSGCFPESLKNFCTTATFEFSSNPFLPWQGSSTQYCLGEIQIGAPCDDGDPLTIDDAIDENCNCIGIYDFPIIPEMILVEGGTFDMGCTEEQEPGCSDHENPIHQVTVASVYAAKHEVTQSQWQFLFGNNPSRYTDCGGNCPVDQISWYDAIVYCNRLSENEGLTPCYYADEDYTQIYGKPNDTWNLPNAGEVFWLQTANGYRLPTEAEWEFVARGGNQSQGYTYAGSNDIEDVAWYKDNSGIETQPVSSKIPNELGFFDMSGNVWEPCWDSYDSAYYNESPNCQPTGPNDRINCVFRGGSFSNAIRFCRTAHRGENTPDYRYYRFGLRLFRGALDPDFCPSCMLTLEARQDGPSCPGMNIGSINLTPSGGNGPYSYNWDNGVDIGNGDGLTISSLAAGTYQVTLTDASTSCNATTTIEIIDGIQLDIDCVVTNPVSTVGGQEGAATLTLTSGQGPFQINWSGPVNGNQEVAQTGEVLIDNLLAGTYDVIVIDANGCEVSCNFSISDFVCTLTVNSQMSQLDCGGNNLGSLILIPSNGTGPYQYEWQNGNQNNNGEGLTISDLAQGTYQLTLTDESNGCTANTEINIGSIDEPQINCQVSKEPTTIGNNNAVGLVTISGNYEGPFDLAWRGPSNGQLNNLNIGDQTIENLSAGMYLIEVTYGAGCKVECQLLIEDPNCNLELSNNKTSPRCAGNNNGQIILVPTNGTGPYQFQWNNGLETDSGVGLLIEDLAAGTYNITLTDEFIGCSKTTTVVLTPGQSPSITCREASPVTNIEGNNGIIELTIESGQPPYTISGRGPTNIEVENLGIGKHEIERVRSGAYAITVTDANGCVGFCNVTISENIVNPCVNDPVERPEPVQQRITFCPGETIPTLSIRPKAGIRYDWYDQRGTLIRQNTQNLNVNQPGLYFVEAVRLIDGCTSLDRTTIEVARVEPISIEIGQAICLEGNPVTYFVQLTIINAVEVKSNFGEFIQSENSYTFLGLPQRETLVVTAINNEGCEVQRNIPPPVCDCPELEAPIISQPNILYCPSDETIGIEASVPNNQTVYWYNSQFGGIKVGEGQWFRPELQGQYYAEAVDLSNGCFSGERTTALFFPQAEPLIRDIDKFCDADQDTYTILLEIINGKNITFTAGQLENRGTNQFAIVNIPIESNVTVDASVSVSNCVTSFTAQPPTCICDSLPAPTILNVFGSDLVIRYCSNEPKPLIQAESQLGTSINWYTEVQGGELLASQSSQFRVPGPGNYYLETISPTGQCISRERTGIRVEEIFQPFSEIEVFTCNMDSVGTSDTLLFPYPFGCDSMVITTYHFDGSVPEILDTQLVCNILDTGIVETFGFANNCPVKMVTNNIYFENSELAFIVEDTIINCELLETVTIEASTPTNSFGEWFRLDGSSIDIIDPFTEVTEVQFLRPGWNRFIWSLSNEFCSDFNRDTVSIWNPIEIEANDLIFEQVEPGTPIESDLLANDTFNPDGYFFNPLDYPENPAPEFTFDEIINQYTGYFTYFNSDPTILQFQYELCDAYCIENSLFCDTASVRAVFCGGRSLNDIKFDNGFDPYLETGELFDPLNNIIEQTCDFVPKQENATLTVYGVDGKLLYESNPYEPWNGRTQNSPVVLPTNQYHWIMSLKVMEGDSETTRVWSGSILIYHE